MRRRRIGDAALAIVAGAAAAHGFPPDGLPWMLFLGYAALAVRLPDASPRRAALLAWLFGTALQFTAIAWISESFLVPMPAMGRLALLPILGLAAGLGLFPALAAYIWRRFWPGASAAGAAPFLGLAVAFSLSEWLMGHVLTGFPWAIVSLAVAEFGYARAASLVGAYGVGLLSLAAALGLGGAVMAAIQARRLRRADSALAIAVLLVALAAPIAAELGRPGSITTGKDLSEAGRPVIRMVQGNTPQRQKWEPENRAAIFARHMALSRAPAARPLTAIVWPETATPFPVTVVETAMAAIAAAAPQGGYVILGAPLRETRPEGGYRHTNSLIAVPHTGGVAARYDKAHLVPGGEYVPFEDYLPFGRLIEGRGSFTAGPGVRTIRLAGLPAFSPLICYEVIFPSAVALDDDRPAFLLNLTNDAWYGQSAGPYQHLAIARMRAIEEGLPLIRVANTGISAAFDASGRELGRIPLEQTGFLDIALPSPLPPTLYARYGDLVYFGLIVAFAAIALGAGRWSGRRSARRTGRRLPIRRRWPLASCGRSPCRAGTLRGGGRSPPGKAS